MSLRFNDLRVQKGRGPYNLKGNLQIYMIYDYLPDIIARLGEGTRVFSGCVIKERVVGVSNIVFDVEKHPSNLKHPERVFGFHRACKEIIGTRFSM